MEETRKVKYRIMKRDIPKPEGWPELELTIFDENEMMGIVREETITINCELIEIMSFKSSQMKGSDIVFVELTNGKEYKIKMKYSKFKTAIRPWIQYANWVRDISIMDLREDELEKAEQGDGGSEPDKK
jgi:hypothetical protein